MFSFIKKLSARDIFIFFYGYKIFRRLIPSIIRRIPFKKKVLINIHNFQIFLNLKSSMDREIYLKGVYDKEKLSFCENKVELSKFDLFLDIGSYIGYYSLYLASKYKNLKVLAFEPIIESFSQIKVSKESNKFDNIEIFNYALSNTKGEQKFWCTNLNKKSGFAFYKEDDYKAEVEFNNYDHDKISFKNIRTEIFDKQFKIQDKLIFIKIDVERHEYDVLLGAVIFLSKSNNKIFLQIEIEDELKDNVLKLLKEYNFHVKGEISKGGHDYYLSNYDI